MIKTYVLDTNVLLDDPSAVSSFDDNNVIIPLIVIEEMDRFKDKPGDLGANAREFSRFLSKFIQDGCDLRKGAPTKDGGTIRVVTMSDLEGFGADLKSLPELDDYHGGDNKILQVVIGLTNKAKKENAPSPILVTRDIQLRVKCSVLNLLSEDRRKGGIPHSLSKLYSGIKTAQVSWDIVQAINEERDGPMALSSIMRPEEYNALSPNEYVVLQAPDLTMLNSNVYRHNPDERLVHPLRTPNVYKLKPRNMEQRVAIDMLMDPKIKLCSIIGRAGSGKTLCALAAGLEQVVGQRKYKTLFVCRPIQPVGRDIGYLPGPQPLDAKILTPTGWTTMGEIKVGDSVIAHDGTPAKVLGVYPKGKKEVYRLTTTDGASTEACDDHLWFSTTWEEKKRGKNGSVKSTKEIRKTLSIYKNKKERPNHYLPRNKEILFDKTKPLPLSPYVLGVLLGDGSITNSISITSQNKDSKEVIGRVKKEIKELGCRIRKVKGTISWYISSDTVNNKPANSVLITNVLTGEVQKFGRIGEASDALKLNAGTIYHRCNSENTYDDIRYEFISDAPRWSNPVKNILFELGVLGTKSNNKFIPKSYLFGSLVEDRIALLQGLMDTDGTIKTNGEASFITASPLLRDDIVTLVKSLGGNATPRIRDRRGLRSSFGPREIESKLICYDIGISLPSHINPFFLKRKAERHKCSYIRDSKITSIVASGFKEVQCIEIDHPDHLYITDDFIVTHNTVAEKLEPWVAPIKDNLKYLLSSGDNNDKKSKQDMESTFEWFVEKGIIEVEAMTYIRGRSISNAYMIIDEAQNLSAHELKTIITRVGEGTKIVLTGDVEQIDNLYVDSSSNGLTVAVEKFKNSALTSHITLVKGERSELATLASNCLD